MRHSTTIVFAMFLFCLAVLFFGSNFVFAEKIPTLDEIAHANGETWAVIETVDMEFAVINEIVADDEVFLTTSLQNRWIFTPDKERLIRVYDLGDSDSLLSDSLLDENALREHQATTDRNGVLFCGTISPAVNPIWQSKVNLAPYLLRYPCGEIDLDTTKTLGWIIENWPTIVNGSHLHEEDTIWHLHVQCPAESPWCGGEMQIEVNAAKGFLVQKVTVNGLDFGLYADEQGRTTLEMQVVGFVRSENGGHFFPSGFVSRQFAEPVDEKSLPHTIYKEIPTRLTVNDKLTENCFDFKFEKYEIVTEYDALSEITAIYLWGEDNRPMEAFATYAELDRWQFRRDITAFVIDYCTLPRIIGRDLGHIARHTIAFGQYRLALERHRKQEKLRELAQLPIEKPGADSAPMAMPGELLTEETPIKSPQAIETTATTEFVP